ncbi:MAG TPA: hypothetical protein DCZ10_03345 [Pelotomaculum sp.]|nr:hypothetical protein [Pelotomaculum sp.]
MFHLPKENGIIYIFTNKNLIPNEHELFNIWTQNKVYNYLYITPVKLFNPPENKYCAYENNVLKMQL